MAEQQSRISILLDLNAKGFDTQLRRAQRDLTRFGGKMKTIGRGMSFAVTAPLAAAGIASVKLAVDFEKSMAKVQAISGASSKEFEQLAASARNFGATTAFTAQEVAGLQLELSKLGFKSNEILAATEGVLDLAFAFDNELADTAATAAEVLNQFALDASKTGELTDLMAAAFSNSALDLETFGEAMSKAGPVARAAGLDVKETTAILGILANNGIKGADAGTKLKIALTEIRSAGLPVRETLKAIANGTFDFESGLDLLGKRAEIINPILSSNADELAKFTGALDNSTGALGEAVDVMEDTASGALKKMQSSLQGAGESLGMLFLPAVVAVADAVAGLGDWFRDLSSTSKGIISALALLLAAIGPLLFAIGSMASGLSVILPLLLPIAAGIKAIGVAAAAAAGPWTPLILVAMTMVAAIGYVADAWNDQEKAARRAARATKEAESETDRFIRLLGRDIDTESITDLSAAIEDLEEQLEDTKPAQDAALKLQDLATVTTEATGMTSAMAAEVAFLNKELGVAIDTEEDYSEVLDNSIDRMALMAELKAKRAALSARIRKEEEQEAARLTEAVEDAITSYEELIATQEGLFKLGLGEGKAQENLKEMERALMEIIEATILAGGDASAWAKQLEQVQERAKSLESTMRLMDLNADIQAQVTGFGRPQDLDKGLKSPMSAEDLEKAAEAAARGDRNYRAMATSVRMMKDALEQSVDVAAIFSNSLQAAFRQIFTGAKSAGQALLEMAANVLSSIAAQVSALMIQAAVQTALAGGPAAMVLAPALIGVGLGIASAAMSSIPAFAEGGAVLGPTLALVGEKPGSRGEAIIPFEKIGQFVDQVAPSGGVGDITVHGRISGSDIALSSSRGAVARSRRR